MSQRHDVRCDGLFPLPRAAGGSAPTIISSMRQEFVEHLVACLATPEGRDGLLNDVASDRDENVLSLYQPVHRVFHPVVVQAWCTTHQRRLNPKRIVSAGLVVRRVTGSVVEGWMKEGGKVLGWRPLPWDAETLWDPSAEERKGLRSRKAPYYRLPDRRSDDGWSEDSVSLFPVPPEVGAFAKATLLFGIPPLASMEVPEDVSEPPFSEVEIAARLPKLLSTAAGRVFGTEPVSATIYRSWRDTRDESNIFSAEMFAALWYLANEVGAFSPDEPAGELKSLLAEVAIDYPYLNVKKGTAISSLWEFLAYARDVLLAETQEEVRDVPSQIRLPEAWPVIDTGLQQKIVAAIATCMKRRWQKYASPEARFQTKNARYVIRAFLRVRCEDHSEPVTVWSPATEEFIIKPWHAASPAPPVVVPLPELDPESMKKMKPAVAFQVPASIQNFMDGMKLKDAMDGKKPKDGGSTVLKLCCFSIPIVTICAFIVLQIFLSLLNIFLGWMPFVRICFPILKSGNTDTNG